MNESPSWLIDTQDLTIPNIAGQDSPLASIALPVNSNIFTQNMDVGNQETASSASSNTLTLSYLSLRNQYEPASISHDEHQPSWSGDAKSKPFLRKSHAKSRRGCFTCKKRRIKCPENHPICTQCTKRGFICEWPEVPIRQAESVTKKSPSIPRMVESSTPKYTLLDLRLFYHFIQDAYPYKPNDNDSIWTHEIPSIAHNYNYLLHAMLALSASDIEAKLDQHSTELTKSAICHRVLAIKYLNRALSTGLHTFEEGNAMLATCFSLMFQSTLIGEGHPEYLSFIRGCVLVSVQMGSKGLKILFQNLLSNDEFETVDTPAVDLGPVDAAYASLEAFEHLCERESEKAFHACLLEIVRNLYLSSRDAYTAWMKANAFFSYQMSHADFQTLIDASNPVGQLLQSHLIAVQTLMNPVSLDERSDRKALQLVSGMVRWLGVIHANVKPGMRRYFGWPAERAEEVKQYYLSKRALADA